MAANVRGTPGKVVGRAGAGSGVQWPLSGSGAPDQVNDVFGGRPFFPHVATVGYDYDFHRGIDVLAPVGTPVYSPVNGQVVRSHYSHFDWKNADHASMEAEYLSRWAILNTAAASITSAVWSPIKQLVLTFDALPAGAFPATAGRYIMAGGNDPARPRYAQNLDPGDIFEFRIKIQVVPDDAAVGVALWDPDNTEWLTIDYDEIAQRLRIQAFDSTGALAPDGVTALGVGVAPRWLRIKWDPGIPRLDFDDSTDGIAWTTRGSSAVFSPTKTGFPGWLAGIYVRGASAVTPVVRGKAQLDFFGGYDAATIPRFGNWLQVVSPKTGAKWQMYHAEGLLKEVGSTVKAGEQYGYSGDTGFDARSGPVLNSHIHLERIPNSNYFYDNADAVNPLGAETVPGESYLPRAQTSNVAAVLTEANDPDGAASWKLTVTVQREDQAFDINEFEFVGSTATRTINWNTRAGLNADVDIPKQAGVYIEPVDFDATDTEYICAFFFNKAIVGAGAHTWTVKDTAGATLASG